MKSMVLLTLTLTVAVLVLASLATADVPQMINYQGRLTDSLGAPLDTTVSMVFTIYDDSTGGTSKWTETHPTVTVTNGLFSVILGVALPIDDSVFNQPDRWLGITVGVDPELTPRTRLLSVGYSHRVSTVDGANGGIISGDVNIQSDLSVSGKATIGPGHTNTGTSAFVAGANNQATNDYSTVGGGEFNQATGLYSTVGGGYSNDASGERSTVAGGYDNTASGLYSAVSGGQVNIASGELATAAGGLDNVADSHGCAIGGGRSNYAGGCEASTVGGGIINTANGDYSVVCGGSRNTAGRLYSTVCGGFCNETTGNSSVIVGGRYDTLTAEAEYSMAFGEHVYLNNGYRVVFFDGGNFGHLGVNRDDQDGGINHPIHVGTGATNGNGAHLTNGGVWTDASSREFKENFQALDGEELLDKVSSMPVPAWNYKNSDERHVGPMAEDFVAAFNVGTIREDDGQRENHYLAARDVAGVALIGVKELAKQNQELRERIVQLEALVETLLAQRDGSSEAKAEFGMSK